jgi:hypothetical protein
VNRLGHRDTGADAPGDGTQPAPGADEEHRSPGLKAALAGSASRPGCRVLDLGPAVQANVAFLTRCASHLSIADLCDEHRASETGGQGWSERLATVVGPFDLVLVWDLLSYLDRRQAKELVDRLRCVAGPSLVLYLLVHEGPEMPARPRVYEIRGEEAILYRAVRCGRVAAPRIPPVEVTRLLAGFRIDASFLLRHGVREYVAVCEQCDVGHNL